MHLDQRRVLVTGAANGIGLAVRQQLEEAGAAVVALDTRPIPGGVDCDVSSEVEVERAFAEGIAGGGITDVVHAAGILMSAPVAETSLEDWQRIISVNLTGSFLVGREAARRLPDGGGLVFVSSVAGLSGDPSFGAYSASKFGMVALTQVLARELAPRGIRVNAVCPGGVRTAFSDHYLAEDARRRGMSEAEIRAEAEADVFLGRWASPDEVASACLFLLSDAASYISGHSLVLNGGGDLSFHR